MAALVLHCHVDFRFKFLALYHKNFLRMWGLVKSHDWISRVVVWEVWAVRLRYDVRWRKLLVRISLLANLGKMVMTATFLARLSVCWAVASSVSSLQYWQDWFIPLSLLGLSFSVLLGVTALISSSLLDISVLFLSSFRRILVVSPLLPISISREALSFFSSSSFFRIVSFLTPRTRQSRMRESCRQLQKFHV